MPNDQIVSHYQSIFDQKNHLNFSALVESKIAGIVLNVYNFRTTNKPQKCCQLPISAIMMKIPKMAKIVL